MSSSLQIRDKLQRSAERRQKAVEVSGLGTVHLQSLTERERSEIESSPIVEMRARLIQKCVVDEGGLRIFGDNEVEDIQTFDAGYTIPLFEAITEFLGTVPAVEDAVKN